MLTSTEKQNLIKQAMAAREQAYAPYSHYTVGTAVLTAEGNVYTGCNIENAAYPSSMCGERVAIFKAVSEGHRNIVAIAVVTRNGGSPCGGCRQVMREFASLEMPVILTTIDDGFEEEFTLGDLLPRSFGPDDLDRK